jgi:anti-sigma28 factor (negative regulator of flagellin synthesis)
MYVGPPPGRSSPRLLAVRTLAAICLEQDEPDTHIARRVKVLRDQVHAGTYRVSPERLAASLYLAVMAGGL